LLFYFVYGYTYYIKIINLRNWKLLLRKIDIFVQAIDISQTYNWLII